MTLLLEMLILQVAYSYLYSVLQVRNEKARKYLTDMRKKQPVSFTRKFPNADPLALRLLQRLLAFDPKDRPTAEEVSVTDQILYKMHFLLKKKKEMHFLNCVINLGSKYRVLFFSVSFVIMALNF